MRFYLIPLILSVLLLSACSPEPPTSVPSTPTVPTVPTPQSPTAVALASSPTGTSTLPAQLAVTLTPWPTATRSPTPSSTPTPTAVPYPACSGSGPYKFVTGQLVNVSSEEPDPNRVRALPSQSARILDLAQPGQLLLILDGPACADGYIWWKVQVWHTGQARDQMTTGWTVEGDGQKAWLVSMPVDTGELECERQGDAWQCLDKVLQVEYRYPAAWGQIIRTNLYSGPCSGEGYFYHDDSVKAPSTKGLSLDYCVVSGRSFTTYFDRGFKAPDKDNPAGYKLVDGCSLVPGEAPYTAECSLVSPQVALYNLVPKPGVICSLDPPPMTLEREPVLVIVIDLPPESRIAGFTFVVRPLSPALRDYLFQPLGEAAAIQDSVNTTYANCQDPAAVQAYEERLAALTEQIRTRSADAETNQNLLLAEALARSVQYWQP